MMYNILWYYYSVFIFIFHYFCMFVLYCDNLFGLVLTGKVTAGLAESAR